MELEPLAFRYPEVLTSIRACRGAFMETVDDEALDAVNQFTLRNLSRKDIALFQLDLCHNQVDRHFSRFPDEELERINSLVIGKPLMERHDLRGSLPRGRFFRSSLHREGERLCVRPEVYVLRTAGNREFIQNIEGGIFRDTSIGFSFRIPECAVCGKDMRECEHVPGQRYDDIEAHYIMRQVTDVIEGSIVSSGSQGTGFIATKERSGQFLQALHSDCHPAEFLDLSVAGKQCKAWAEE